MLLINMLSHISNYFVEIMKIILSRSRSELVKLESSYWRGVVKFTDMLSGVKVCVFFYHFLEYFGSCYRWCVRSGPCHC